MNLLLSVANGFLAYRRGQETGLVGLFAIGLTILLVFQWHNLVPVFEALGIVDFFERNGMIHEDSPELTGFHIFSFFVKAAISFIIVGFILIVLGLMIVMFTSSNFGGMLIMTVVMIPMVPFMVLWMIYDYFRTPKEERIAFKKEGIRQREHMKKPIIQVIKESSVQLTEEQAFQRLNRLPTLGDDMFLIGINYDEEVFAILPRPTYMDDAKYEKEEFCAIKYSVEKKKLPSFSKEDGSVITEFELKTVFNWPNMINSYPYSEFEGIFQTNHVDFLEHFKEVKNQDFYQEYVKYIQSMYFQVKEKILSLISDETDKDKFDKLVQRAISYNASNEDVVRLMYEAEKGAVLINE